MSHLYDPISNASFGNCFFEFDFIDVSEPKDSFRSQLVRLSCENGRERIDSEEFETSSNEKLHQRKRVSSGCEAKKAQKKRKLSKSRVPNFHSLEVT